MPQASNRQVRFDVERPVATLTGHLPGWPSRSQWNTEPPPLPAPRFRQPSVSAPVQAVPEGACFKPPHAYSPSAVPGFVHHSAHPDQAHNFPAMHRAVHYLPFHRAPHYAVPSHPVAFGGMHSYFTGRAQTPFYPPPAGHRGFYNMGHMRCMPQPVRYPTAQTSPYGQYPRPMQAGIPMARYQPPGLRLYR